MNTQSSETQTTRAAPTKLRTQGISHRALREEVAEYFEAGASIAQGDVIVDVGANIGAFALEAAERTHGDVTVHCFEPAIPTFQLLQRNFRQNRLLRGSKHTLNCLALSRPEFAGQEKDFYFFKRLPTDSTNDIDGKHREFEKWCHEHANALEKILARWVPLLGAPLGAAIRITVHKICSVKNPLGVWLADRVAGLQVMPCRTETLQNWVEQNKIDRIDLMKMDVEGAEVDVLAGVGKAWAIIQQVAIETHDRDNRVAEVHELLRAHGFRSIKNFKPHIAYSSESDNVLIIGHRSAEA